MYVHRFYVVYNKCLFDDIPATTIVQDLARWCWNLRNVVARFLCRIAREQLYATNLLPARHHSATHRSPQATHDHPRRLHDSTNRRDHPRVLHDNHLDNIRGDYKETIDCQCSSVMNCDISEYCDNSSVATRGVA